MQLVFRPQAEADLDAIVTYLVERSPSAAVRIQETIRAQVKGLINRPGLGRPGRIAGPRELVIARTPYIVPYVFDQLEDTIYLLRVFHGARMWPQDLEGE